MCVCVRASCSLALSLPTLFFFDRDGVKFLPVSTPSATALQRHKMPAHRSMEFTPFMDPAHQPAHSVKNKSRQDFVDATLKDLYFNVNNVSAYSSLKTMVSAAAPHGITPQEVKKWLFSQEIFTRFHRARYHFPTNFYNITAFRDVFECDLNDMRKLSELNSGYNYFLCVICCLSRMVWAIPLKTKTAAEVACAFDVLFSSGVKCRLLQCDKGREFVGATVQRVLKKHNVRFRTLENKGKAAMVERANGRLKAPLWKHMAAQNNWRWVDPLKKIVHAYNRTPHSAILNMRPIDVSEKDVFKIWSHIYLRHMNKSRTQRALSHTSMRDKRAYQKLCNKFKIGDYVRVSLIKRDCFEKGYTPRFSQQVYKIKSLTRFQPLPMYELNDLQGVPLKGNWYAQELLKVEPPTSDTVYRVEKVLRRRKLKGHPEEALVRWQGYDKHFDSWEPASSLTDI